MSLKSQLISYKLFPKKIIFQCIILKINSFLYANIEIVIIINLVELGYGIIHILMTNIYLTSIILIIYITQIPYIKKTKRIIDAL